MIAETVATLVTQIIGAGAILTAIFYIVHLVARFDLDLGDRYRIEADRNREVAKKAQQEADASREAAERARTERDNLKDQLDRARNDIAQVKDTIQEVHKDIKTVNEAVNHKDAETPTLIQRIIDQDKRSVQLGIDLAKERDWIVTSIKEIADHLKVVLPPEPPAIIAPVIQLEAVKE